MDSQQTNLDREPLDPLAGPATDFAMHAEDDTKPKHPGRDKAMFVLIIILLVVGTFAATVTAINSIVLRHTTTQQSTQTTELKQQNAELKAQQKCQNNLLKAFTKEQRIRSNIADDDRRVLRELVSSIGSGVPFEVALHRFNVQNHRNDVRRAHNPVPVIKTSVCHFTVKNGKIVPNPQPGASSSPGSTPSGSGGSNGAQPSQGAQPPAGTTSSRTNVTIPVGQPRPTQATSTHNPGPRPTPTPQPHPTPTHTTAKPPVPKPHPTPIITIPPICVDGLICVGN